MTRLGLLPHGRSVLQDPAFQDSLQEDVRRAIDAIPGLVWSALPDGRLDFFNRRWCEYTGLDGEEACRGGWQAALCPDDLPAVLAFWQALLADGRPGETEARLRRHDGAYRWFQVRAVPLLDPAGRLVRWYGQSVDVDDRRRAEALLAGERRLLEMVTSGCPAPEVLAALCRLVEDFADGCHCSVLLVGPGGRDLRHAAAPTLPPQLADAVHGRLVLPYWGPCAMAVHLETQVIVADAAADGHWEPPGEWRGLVLACGLRSCWSTPVFSQAAQVLGTFAIYRRDPGSPTPQLRSLIERLTHIASIAIERTPVPAALGEEADLAALRGRRAALGRREREVMDLVAAGLLNKQIAARLGISEATVKAHRGQVMRKMKAGSLAELVRMAARLEPAAP